MKCHHHSFSQHGPLLCGIGCNAATTASCDAIPCCVTMTANAATALQCCHLMQHIACADCFCCTLVDCLVFYVVKRFQQHLLQYHCHCTVMLSVLVSTAPNDVYTGLHACAASCCFNPSWLITVTALLMPSLTDQQQMLFCPLLWNAIASTGLLCSYCLHLLSPLLVMCHLWHDDTFVCVGDTMPIPRLHCCCWEKG